MRLDCEDDLGVVRADHTEVDPPSITASITDRFILIANWYKRPPQIGADHKPLTRTPEF